MKARTPSLSAEIFKKRRDHLAQMTPGSATVCVANFEQVRNGHHHFPFRQNSNFFYLTGFEEPEAVLVFRPGLKPESVLFVRPRDKEKEIWDGFRYGPEGARQFFGVDEAYTLDQLPQKMAELLKPVDRVYYSLRVHPDFDIKFLGILESVKLSRGRSGLGLTTIQDLHPVVGEMRVIKAQKEISAMRRAAQISVNAHLEVMRQTRPGVSEMYLQGVFMGEILKQGGPREAYTPILATGSNATCLHYVFNDQTLKDGDLFLIDAACEYQYYSSDITRTYPVNGKFSPEQKALYQQVLDVQKKLVAMVKPGVTYQQIQDEAVNLLTQSMIELKLLQGSVEENIKNQNYKRFYPHSVGHFLGLDTHDAGLYMQEGQSRSLQPGITLTIEPGIYIQPEDVTAPEAFRGLGVRIEDDILVTTFGNENMTAGLPKEVADLEALIGSGNKK